MLGSFSDGISATGGNVSFAHGDVSAFEVTGLDGCTVAPAPDEPDYRTPVGRFASLVRCTGGARRLSAPFTIAWTLRYRPQQDDAAVPGGRDIYLLMGQSNMAGRGVLADIPPGTLGPDPRIRLYGNDGVWRTAAEPIDSDIGQVDPVSGDKDAGVEPGLAFAKAMVARDPARPIGLVPCAKGGSGITEWPRAAARDTLYGSCLARARAAMASGRIAGILWYQGETDAHDTALAIAWAARFTAMIRDFRADLGRPDLPLVVVGIGDQPMTGKYADRFPEWRIVQDAQAALRLPNQGYVAAAGLPRNPDDLHLTTAAQIRLGAALAGAMTLRDKDRR